MNRQIVFNPGVILTYLFYAFNALGQTGKDWVDGDVIELVKDGAWCWFQDERAVVDIAKEKLVVGSANVQAGVDVTIYDLKTKKVESKKAFGKLQYADDHNAPGLLVLPNGNYLAMWAHHYDAYYTHYSLYDGAQWSAEKKFDWETIPGGTNYTIAYNNVYYLSTEQKIYDFSRANNKSPNFLLSLDSGKTWKFGGQLSTDVSNSYNRGYYKYWGNGVDRIDFCCTEQHPRDFTTSIYHGYIKGGMCHKSDGTVVDSNIFDVKDLPVSGKNFTQVFANGTVVNGVPMIRCWESDIQVYEDNTIAILFEARANGAETDHRNFYSRYDGKAWKTSSIGKAGSPIYSSEQDYTGLGALCPDDPNKVYISSPYNPGDDAGAVKKREIWRGTTSDKGETWKWEPITANSSVDNFRPIVPKWKPGKEALLWFRGTYTSAQTFTLNIVGTIHEYSVGASENTRESNSFISAVSIIPGPYSSGSITVQYTVPKICAVTLGIFSASGNPATPLTHGTVAAGAHRATFNTGRLPAGVYFCGLIAGEVSKVIPVGILRYPAK